MFTSAPPSTHDPADRIHAWSGAGARIAEAEYVLLERGIEAVQAGSSDEAALALDTVSTLAALRLDGESLAAAMLLDVPESRLNNRGLAERFGVNIAALVAGARRMRDIHALLPGADPGGRSSDRTVQVERLRQMLLAMAQDARVVLIHLAWHVAMLRQLVRAGSPQQRADAARETFELLSPLANRLGTWQLKWEMEDLAFRCRDPETYRAIAKELDGKRGDREAFIEQVTRILGDELAAAGIRAEVSGRPKHIYSIWKKMQRKDLGFKDLFDVRAARIIVDDVKDCYTALGIVHNLWVPIPREFDDYIAKPKANSYRSLHTAVIGPEDKVLEVQIRTHEMHQSNELGIAAHWRYKEGGRRDPQFEERIAWLRQVLDWKLGSADSGDIAESFRTELIQDSVYVLTPQGRVIALPKGATPIDFAYHVHTDLGHRCRGAKVNGQIVPLTYELTNGQRVEITAAREGGPSRDWLNPSLGYLRSARARTKVRQWFNNQHHEQAVTQGRGVLEREVHRVGGASLPLEQVATALAFEKVDDFLAALGRGEVGTKSLQTVLRGEAARTTPIEDTPALPEVAVASGAGPAGVLVVGVDRLLTQLARCCRPVPPDPVVGFVTRGRGVSVHRADYSNVRQLPAERRVEVAWGKSHPDSRFQVDLEVRGNPEQGLLKAVVDALGREKVPVRAARASDRGRDSRVRVTVEVVDGAQVQRLASALGEIPGVVAVRRC